ncbi:hypothetical protein VUR80DRAFT_5071 [Thermomyces stellatus]
MGVKPDIDVMGQNIPAAAKVLTRILYDGDLEVRRAPESLLGLTNGRPIQGVGFHGLGLSETAFSQKFDTLTYKPNPDGHGAEAVRDIPGVYIHGEFKRRVALLPSPVVLGSSLTEVVLIYLFPDLPRYKNDKSTKLQLVLAMSPGEFPQIKPLT